MLDREREEFFDTRVTGRAEIWSTLKVVTGLLQAGEIETAQGIIDAAGITVPTGDLINGVYDEQGNLYQMSRQILADPTNIAPEEENPPGGTAGEESEECDEELEKRKEEKGKGVLKTEDMVKVKARLSDRGGPDVDVNIGKDENVRVLARIIKEEAGVSIVEKCLSH
jgi:hypothetical protein